MDVRRAPLANFQIQHLVEIAVEQSSVPADGQGVATHQAADSRRIERIDRLGKSAVAALRICVFFEIAGQRSDNLDLTGGQKLRQIVEAWGQQDRHVAEFAEIHLQNLDLPGREESAAGPLEFVRKSRDIMCGRQNDKLLDRIREWITPVLQ